ncbi:zinc finger CCHC domain-containing protein 24 isoform X2 [Bicyclus anynana]|uniref:Zinc finger CCHC domain-containing protein 24 isoform X2 n=1 Tax=Bicyclus anynana TaxID=110368 RepID=A0ABM3LE39_BICAN|nr:zinc finger CCHC domain-containing protein 24 isoform X2 [Bicyclus anynana]
MGCFWSRQGCERCVHCDRKAVNNLVIIDHVCEICISRATATRTHHSSAGPKFGEYRCNSCSRYWTSRLCWPDKYQMCKYCKKPTLPYQYRDLNFSDTADSSDSERQEHEKNLCQMCQQLGYSCKNFGKKKKPQTTRKSKT